MSTQPPRRRRDTNQTIMVGLVAFLALCVFCSVGLAVVESLTPAKPITAAFIRMFGKQGGNTVQTPTDVALVTLPPTFTPTASPIPATPTPIPPTPTATTSPTATFTHTPHPPTATPLPAATATPTLLPTDTSTPSPTATPTVDADATATAEAQASATAQAQATAAAKATAAAETITTQSRTTLTPTAPPHPPAPRLSGRVAFPIFDPNRGTYDVYIANIDGSGMRQLVTEASQPDLRKDGQRLAFRRWKSDERGLETLVFDTGKIRRYTTFLEDASPVWSPDGGHIIFFSRRESDRQSRIYRFSIHEGGETVLMDGPTVVYGETPSWLPDGRVVYRQTFPQIGIAVMNGYGSDSQIIVSDDRATAPSASPDGKYIAFMSQRDGNWEIYRVNVDGTGLRRLTQIAGNDGLPIWTGDSRTILFVSDRGGSWGMYAMNANGSSQRRLFDLPGTIDGRVAREPDYASRGWVEERITWSP